MWSFWGSGNSEKKRRRPFFFGLVCIKPAEQPRAARADTQHQAARLASPMRARAGPVMWGCCGSNGTCACCCFSGCPCFKWDVRLLLWLCLFVVQVGRAPLLVRLSSGACSCCSASAVKWGVCLLLRLCSFVVHVGLARALLLTFNSPINFLDSHTRAWLCCCF